jgi:ATP-binding cassette subfamily C protein LapB
MTLQVYDRILPNPGSGTLPVLITGVGLAVALEATLRLARAYIMGWAGAAYEHRLSCSAMNHVLEADLSRLGPYGIGEHLHRMSAVTKMKDFYNGYALTSFVRNDFCAGISRPCHLYRRTAWLLCRAPC